MLLLTSIRECSGPEIAVSLWPDPIARTTGFAELTVPEHCSSMSHSLGLLALHSTMDAASTSPLTSRISTAARMLGVDRLFLTTTRRASLAAFTAIKAFFSTAWSRLARSLYSGHGLRQILTLFVREEHRAGGTQIM
jgi:hypothetical protein